MVHQNGQGTLIVIQDVLAGIAIHLYQTIVQRIRLIQSILGQHLPDHRLGTIPDRQQQSLVRHILTQALAINLQSASGIRATILGPELLQLLLQLLLPASPHNRLWVRNGPGERRLWQLGVQLLRHVVLIIATTTLSSPTKAIQQRRLLAQRIPTTARARVLLQLLLLLLLLLLTLGQFPLEIQILRRLRWELL